MPPNVMVNVRVPAADRAALIALSERLGLPQSALLRAGLRAIVHQPQLIYTAPPVDYAAPHDLVDDVVAVPPPPPRRAKRSKRRR